MIISIIGKILGLALAFSGPLLLTLIGIINLRSKQFYVTGIISITIAAITSLFLVPEVSSLNEFSVMIIIGLNLATVVIGGPIVLICRLIERPRKTDPNQSSEPTLKTPGDSVDG